jgi:hypothetical protein
MPSLGDELGWHTVKPLTHQQVFRMIDLISITQQPVIDHDGAAIKRLAASKGFACADVEKP